MKKIAAILSAVTAALAFAAAPAQAAPARPALSSGPWKIIETYGPYSVYSSDVNAGTKVIEASNGRNLTWVDDLASYNGLETGYFTFYNGNFMAATNDCGGVTIKSSIGSNGVVWALQPVSGSNVNARIINRYCDQSPDYNGNSTAALAGSGVLNSQFYICGLPFNCSGALRVFHFSS